MLRVQPVGLAQLLSTREIREATVNKLCLLSVAIRGGNSHAATESPQLHYIVSMDR